MKIRSNRHLILIGSLLFVMAGRADVPETGSGMPRPRVRDILEEKGVKGLAMQLGSAILKLGNQDFSSALAPIKLRPELLQAMSKSDNMAALGKVAKRADGIDCVGFNMLSTEAISLVYILATEEGPWGIKINAYIYEKEFYVSGFAATSSWENIEKMVKTGMELEAKLRISRKGEAKIEPVAGPASR